MRNFVLFSAFIVFSTFSFAQDTIDWGKAYFRYLYNVEEIVVIQNTCREKLLVKLPISGLDSILCRTDSIFNTDNPRYFHLKSYDANNVLRFNASIHLHIKSKNYSIVNNERIIDKEEFLTSPFYQNCLSIESYFVYDKNGKLIQSGISCCHYDSSFPTWNTWDDFGLDEFGTKKTLDYNDIKRMPLDSRPSKKVF